MSATVYIDIRRALSEHLKTMPDVVDIAWENVAYTPTLDTPYLIPALMMAECFQAEIGIAGLNQESGIYQLTLVNCPSGRGINTNLDIMGKLKERFKRGTILTHNGVSVRVRKTYLTGDNIISVAFYTQVPN